MFDVTVIEIIGFITDIDVAYGYFLDLKCQFLKNSKTFNF